MRKISIFFILITVLSTAVLYASGEVGTGRISGTVVIEESGPVTDGTVVFFGKAIGPPPDVSRYMRTPENIATTSSKGKFSAVLPAGTYYIGVTKRLTDKWGGPPREEDIFFISMDEGGARAYVVNKGENIDIGTLSVVVTEKKIFAAEGITAIEGTINDMSGKPVEDVVVFGYTDSKMDKGLAFVSGYTGEDGGYMLRVHKGGTYYLMVMSKFGSLFPGSGMTVLDKGKKVPAGLTVDTGVIKKNVDIKVSLPSEAF